MADNKNNNIFSEILEKLLNKPEDKTQQHHFYGNGVLSRDQESRMDRVKYQESITPLTEDKEKNKPLKSLHKERKPSADELATGLAALIQASAREQETGQKDSIFKLPAQLELDEIAIQELKKGERGKVKLDKATPFQAEPVPPRATPVPSAEAKPVTPSASAKPVTTPTR